MSQLEWKDVTSKTANWSQFWAVLAAILIGLAIGLAINKFTV